ncbi:hypothetical protein DFJ74DRAFT_704438 [Hyaloraphidium curvatum]|nr:hypothetical protein DFJ74DRAFT_704438 [Hyaloraphidium curvatum]
MRFRRAALALLLALSLASLSPAFAQDDAGPPDGTGPPSDVSAGAAEEARDPVDEQPLFEPSAANEFMPTEDFPRAAALAVEGAGDGGEGEVEWADAKVED